MIMNKIFKYMIFAVSVLIFGACEEMEEIEKTTPVFPEDVVTRNVAAGESVELTFSPNIEWKVEISGEGSGNMFWLDDDGMKATSISGKETGELTLIIVFSETEELDNNRVCEVNLTMGGETRKIAEYTRLALGRTFDVYVGVAEEEGFKQENKAYVYGDTKVESASLATFPGTAIYTLPVKVVSNYQWRLALPEWIDSDVMGGTAGSTEFLLTAVLSESQADGVEEDIKFFDASNTEISVEVKITLPAFRDRIETVLQTTFNFNQAGDVQNVNGSYMEDVPAFFELLATDETVVKVIEWNQKGSYYATQFADWATVTEEKYDTESETAVLASYSVQIAVTENDTYDDRYADIFIVPASRADVAFDDWFDPSSNNLKEEFKGYILDRICQPGLERDYITISETDEICEAALVKYNEQQWWSGSLGTDNIFELVYSDQYSDAVLVFDDPFASYKVFDYDNVEVTEDKMENFWLTFNGFASNEKGRVTMDPAKFTRTDAEFPESFIVFYDAAGKVLAGMSCRYTSQVSVVTEDLYEVSSGIAQLTKMDSSSELYEAIFGNFSISDIYQLVIKGKSAYLKANSDHEVWDMQKINPTDFSESESPISIEPASPDLNVYTMNGSEKSEALFILKEQGTDGSLVNFAAIHVIYDPNAAITIEPPFKFVNPDLVGELATISQYSGDLVAKVLDEQFGLTAEMIFELKYNDASATSVAAITIPSAPAQNSGWDNYPVSPNYWLTCEVSGNQMTVFMSEAGKADYFVFKDAQGLPQYALVCTLAE